MMSAMTSSFLWDFVLSCQKSISKNKDISHVTWSTADWLQVIFTDKKQWNLGNDDEFISIWTQSKQNPLEQVKSNLIVQSPKVADFVSFV